MQATAAQCRLDKYQAQVEQKDTQLAGCEAQQQKQTARIRQVHIKPLASS